VKLNPVEMVLVNNPLRTVALRSTVGWLHTAACAPPVDRVLEIGCGQGDGVSQILSYFHPQSVDAFDLDERQVARARERLLAATTNGAEDSPVHLWVGDAEHVEAADGSYDAVFEFTIFHHVPDWRRALAEVHRVLRPGGFFLFEELSTEFFSNIPVMSSLLRRFTVHPWDTMFDFPTFRRALRDAGLRVTALRSRLLPGWHQGVAVRD
jgi:ubiquinone/menaquinone biosynthesis C-methylase UbiE